MAGVTTRKILGDSATGLRITLPSAWTRAMNLRAGDSIEVQYDDVLLAIPRPGPQAERVRQAMEEVER
jgi:bifunctional DNA-binding transcriptional regulator/antitoxin component of YhaV-PrlF toxin-antitoxin module